MAAAHPSSWTIKVRVPGQPDLASAFFVSSQRRLIFSRAKETLEISPAPYFGVGYWSDSSRLSS